MREPATEQERAVPRDANRAELLRLTQTLQRHEQDTIDACRAADSRSCRGDNADELLGTLLDAMVLDSEKHHRLLGGRREDAEAVRRRT